MWLVQARSAFQIRVMEALLMRGSMKDLDKGYTLSTCVPSCPMKAVLAKGGCIPAAACRHAVRGLANLKLAL